MKALNLNPFNLLRQKYPKKEVKMGGDNLEQRVQELEQKQKLLAQGAQEIEQAQVVLAQREDTSPGLRSYLDSKFEEIEARVAQLTPRSDDEEIEQRGFKQGVEVGREEVASAFEKNAIEGEIEPIARRIHRAYEREGLLKDAEEPLVEKEIGAEAEELPDPPYLHVLDEEDLAKLSDEEQKLYFGWTPGKRARLVEA